MRYLIDSNLLIDIAAKAYVSNEILDTIFDYENTVYVSTVSIMEFIHWLQTQKVAPKKKIVILDIFKFIKNDLGFNVKYVTEEHLQTMARLDNVEGHNDAKDRLIIAQAITEKLPLISSDRYFKQYVKMGLDFIPNYR